MKRIIIFIGCAVVLLSACYKNSLEELSGSGDCNTNNMSYASDIRPIINISCAISGCHHAGAVLTFPLTTYDEVKAEAENGLLLKSINHDPSVSAMPKDVSKLSDCQIGKITSWVNAGAPNN